MNWKEPKIVIDIGRGLLTIFLSISAISLAVTEAGIFENFAKHLLLLSVFCLLLVARLCDWMLDQVTAESWCEVLGNHDREKFSSDFLKWDGFVFRVKMYANTYLIFSLIVTIVAIFGAHELMELFRTDGNAVTINAAKALAAITLALFIPYQMLTIESKYSDILFFIMVVVICFFVLFSYFS